MKFLKIFSRKGELIAWKSYRVDATLHEPTFLKAKLRSLYRQKFLSHTLSSSSLLDAFISFHIKIIGSRNSYIISRGSFLLLKYLLYKLHSINAWPIKQRYCVILRCPTYGSLANVLLCRVKSDLSILCGPTAKKPQPPCGIFWQQ